MINTIFFLFNKTKKNNYFLFPFLWITCFFVFLPILIIFYDAFFLVDAKNVSEKFEMLENSIFFAIVRSFFISLACTFISIFIGYPLAYFLYEYKSQISQKFLILLISFPIWSSFFIKLISLKVCFDLLNGQLNSTYGILYTIIGLTYVYLPLAVICIYNILKTMPKNLIYASLDLGFNSFETLLRIIVPFTKVAIYSCVFIIFLPALFGIATSEFLNNENSSKMIGQILNNLAKNNTSHSSEYSRSTISFLVFFLGSITFGFYFAFLFLISENKKIKNTAIEDR